METYIIFDAISENYDFLTELYSKVQKPLSISDESIKTLKPLIDKYNKELISLNIYNIETRTIYWSNNIPCPNIELAFNIYYSIKRKQKKFKDLINIIN